MGDRHGALVKTAAAIARATLKERERALSRSQASTQRAMLQKLTLSLACLDKAGQEQYWMDLLMLERMGSLDSTLARMVFDHSHARVSLHGQLMPETVQLVAYASTALYLVIAVLTCLLYTANISSARASFDKSWLAGMISIIVVWIMIIA